MNFIQFSSHRKSDIIAISGHKKISNQLCGIIYAYYFFYFTKKIIYLNKCCKLNWYDITEQFDSNKIFSLVNLTLDFSYLRVVQTRAILFLKSMSERGGSDIGRL